MSFKVPVIQRDEYTIYLQDISGETWAHCDVRKWSAEVCKRMKQDGERLYEMHGGPWFALNEPAGCKKHQHFLRMMGFRLFTELSSKVGTQYVFKR